MSANRTESTCDSQASRQNTKESRQNTGMDVHMSNMKLPFKYVFMTLVEKNVSESHTRHKCQLHPSKH